MCGTRNFVSVRLYSAPQSHWTIVAIFGICAFGEPVQAGSFAAIKSDPLPGLACSTSLERQAAGAVWDAYWSLDEANSCRSHDVIAALFSSGDAGIANQQCKGCQTETALLLQRTITPRFSGQHHAWPDRQMVAIAASLACPMPFKFWTQICLPTQFPLDRATGGVFGYLYWGISDGNRTSTT